MMHFGRRNQTHGWKRGEAVRERRAGTGAPQTAEEPSRPRKMANRITGCVNTSSVRRTKENYFAPLALIQASAAISIPIWPSRSHRAKG